MVRLEPHHFLCIIMPVVAGVAYAIRHGYDASSMTKKGTAKWKHYLAARKPARVYNISYSENSGSIFDALKTYLLLSPQWQLVNDPRDYDKVKPSEKLRTFDLVLGDRYHMDKVINSLKEHIGRSSRLKSKGEAQGYTPKKVVMVNYYSGTKELTVKSYMVRHLRTYLKRPWDITPVSYIIKPGSARDERQRFLAEWQVMRGKCANTWIVKPARQNKAKGIKVMEDAAAILKYIDTQKEDRFEYVVQKYLERPFLIHGRKFDIRTVFRTSSEPYNPDDLDDELSHITNHCVQEHGPNFSKFEEGNEMWYHQFQAYLDQYHPGLNFRKQCVPVMKSIINASFQAIKSQVTHSVRSVEAEMLCYQAFGFDFMLDEDFRTWLIEINGQPACAEALLPAFTRDTAELVIHPVFGDAGVRPRRHNFERIDPSFGDDFDLEDNPVLPRRSAKAPGGRGRVYAAQ